jgi:hypothetical protein
MRILAIDPGLTGGWCLSETNTTLASGKLPVEKLFGREGYAIPYGVDVDLILVENQLALPGAPVGSTFQIGYGLGLFLGDCHAHGYAVEMVSPAKWTGDLARWGVCVPRSEAGGRKASRQVAENGFAAGAALPDWAGAWVDALRGAKRNSGAEDAILLGLWFWLRESGQKPVRKERIVLGGGEGIDIP